MAPRLGLGNSVTADPASGLFASTPLLLDSYPNAHRAYSVRKLSKDYSGFAMKVREDDSGSNYTADVGFDDDGRVSASSPLSNKSAGSAAGDTLGAWATAGSYNTIQCTTWYDQSGEGVNAVQGIAGSQPKLYSSGSLNTEGDPARAALLFDGSNDLLTIDESGLSLGSTTAVVVFKHSDRLSNSVPWSLSYAIGNFFLNLNLSSVDQFWYDAGNVSSVTATDTQKLFFYRGASGAQQLFVDGSAGTGTGTGTATDAFTDLATNGIGGLSTSSFQWQGEIQEFIVYDSDQTANRSDIEADVNTEFGL